MAARIELGRSFHQEGKVCDFVPLWDGTVMHGFLGKH